MKLRIDERADELGPVDLMDWLEQQNNGELRFEIGMEALRNLLLSSKLKEREREDIYEEAYREGYLEGVAETELGEL